jgi:hypothetical protein
MNASSLSRATFKVLNPNKFLLNMMTLEINFIKDFYDKTEEPTRITRSTDKGDLTTTTVKNIPNPGFRAQSVRLYNKLTDDRKLSRLSLKNFP